MPRRSELVVDDALVVTAAPRRDTRGLPPLPQELASTSEAFRGAHALALAELDAPGPPAPPGAGADQAAHDAWIQGPFARWLTERSAGAHAAAEALGAVREGPASEHIVAAALVGVVYTRLTDRLSALPAPGHLAGDRLLLAHYKKGLDDASAPWRKAAGAAFFHCAKYAAEQTEAAFGLWLELCHERLAALEALRAEADQRSAWLIAESEAEQLEAAGPPPPGPDLCWMPRATRPTIEPGAITAADRDDSSAGRLCALSGPNDDAEIAPPSPQNARDQLYGVRDVRTGVRVSVTTESTPSMDLRPLAAARTQAALAGCFAKHIKPDAPITVAVHASLSVGERGHVKTAEVAGDPSDASRAPDKPLQRCLVQALKTLRFDCSPSGYPTQGKAVLCMRRD